MGVLSLVRIFKLFFYVNINTIRVGLVLSQTQLDFGLPLGSSARARLISLWLVTEENHGLARFWLSWLAT